MGISISIRVESKGGEVIDEGFKVADFISVSSASSEFLNSGKKFA